MIINETRQSLTVFNKYFCDFCKKQFNPDHYFDGKCYICNQDICRSCNRSYEGAYDSYEGSRALKNFCPTCSNSIWEYSKNIDNVKEQIEEAEELRDKLINERWNLIQELRKNWQTETKS